MLHTAAARVGGLDIGFVPGKGGKATAPDAGANGRAVPARRRRIRDFSQQGPSSSISARMATVAHTAPMSSCRAPPTPKSPAPTSTPKAACSWPTGPVFAPGDAKEDWAIFRALSGVLGNPLPFDSLSQLRDRFIARVSAFSARSTRSRRQIRRMIGELAKAGGKAGTAPFMSPVNDFYLTNPIARASTVMAECSALGHPRRSRQAAE